MIPFLDLKSQHKELEEELIQVFRKALRNAAFIGGHQVEAFENEFADFCGVEYCVGVNSGTDALRFALIASGIGPGDEVITVPNTFVATAEAISQTGATPAFVDIDEPPYTMAPQRLREYLEKRFASGGSRANPRPRAVLPVHLYGQPADMDSIREIASRYDLVVIEDACQAHGAEYFSVVENRWKKAGSMGLAAAFSFYPSKNLGACGEGGAVTTNSQHIAQKVRMLRDHGQTKKYFHEMEGYNGRLDSIQAAILRIKLRDLPDRNESRRKNAQLYGEVLANIDGVIVPKEADYAKHVYHIYAIRVHHRDLLVRALTDKDIQCGIHYPIPIHLQEAYQFLGKGKGSFSVAEKCAEELVSLPMFPELSEEEIRDVGEEIRHTMERL